MRPTGHPGSGRGDGAILGYRGSQFASVVRAVIADQVYLDVHVQVMRPLSLEGHALAHAVEDHLFFIPVLVEAAVWEPTTDGTRRSRWAP